MRNAVALLFACLALVTPSAVPAETLEDVVRDLEAAYSRMTDLRAEFTQTAFNKSLNQTIPAAGTVYLKKGGKLRWEYTEPTRQVIVSDGKTIWLYTPQLNDAEGNVVLDLSPKRPLPTLTRLILSFDPDGWQVRKAVVYDQFENTVTMKFSKLAINSGLEDKLFAFVPPKGTATVPLK